MVRSNELSFARRGALQKLAASRQGARPSVLTGLLVGLDPDDDSRVVVSFDGSDVSVLAGPQKLVPGTVVAVEVDSSNAPVRVTGPVTTRPEGLDEDVPAPAPVVPMPDLAPAEFSPEDQARVDQAVADIGQAQADLAHALPIVDLLEDLGAGNGEVALAEGLAQYISLPLDQITIVDNRGADGQVIANLYDAIIVDGLLLAQEVITGSMLATGAVTANALNVVHVDPATGYGFRLDPEGMTILDQDGNAAIVLRSDMTNYFSVVKDGVAQASISPDGEIVGQSVSANENLLYRGLELEDRLVEPARGIIKQTRNGNSVTVGTSSSRLLAATFRTPATDRMVTVTVKGTPAEGAPRLLYQLRQSTGDSVGPNNSLQTLWYGPAYPTGTTNSFEWSFTRSVAEWGWPYDATITVGLFVRSLDTGKSTLFAISSYDQAMIVRDDGPAVVTETHTPWAPASGGGDGSGSEVQPGKRDYTAKWNASSHRTFPTTGLRHVRADKSLVQGYIAGVHSTGHWYFPSATSTLTGATDLTGTLTIRNEYTGSSSGMTIGLWAHNYATPQTSFGTASKIADIHVARGQTKTITLPASVLNGLKAGTIKGFGLSHGGTTNIGWYGYYSPSATLTINYKK